MVHSVYASNGIVFNKIGLQIAVVLMSNIYCFPKVDNNLKLMSENIHFSCMTQRLNVLTNLFII